MVKLQQNYLEKEVFQGSSLDHVLMLYGKAINSLKLVKKNVEEGLNTPEAVKNKAEALTKAIDILVYLQAILDHEKGGDIATKL
ncbi:MAG: flagellar export chaperone FliS, partial [Caldimicrobium sp.]